MKITFQKEAFLEQLYPTMATVSTKNTITSIEGVLIETMPGGRLQLTTYDMNKGVRTYVEDVTVEQEGSFIINAGRLMQIVKVMPADSAVTIEVDERLNVRIGNEQSSFSMFALRGRDFPALPDLNGDRGFTIKSSVLRSMINKVIHSVAGQESNRPALMGAYFRMSAESLEVVSCDSYTLSKCRVACEIEGIGAQKEKGVKEAFNIPGHALSELVRMLGDNNNPVEILLGNRHAVFHIDDVTFFTRLIDGEYFDYERILPKEQTITVRVNRARLLAGLERAMLVAEEKYAGSGRSYVKITLSGNSLVLTSTSVGGNVSDEMICEHTGDDLEIGFNCRFLINSVRAADSENIDIAMKSPNQSITMVPTEKSEEKDFFYMVLPVRMNN